MPDLYPFQETGRDFLSSRTRALLADQPGLGKTPQAIRALLDVAPSECRVCVICPKVAVENWKRELRRWGGEKLAAIARGTMVTHYEAISKGHGPEHSAFMNTDWDFVIIDEAHRLKSPGAKRTRIIYGRINKLLSNPRRACWVWLLTGTPAKNHTGELYTHLAILRPDLVKDRSGRVMSAEQFEEKYCNVGYDERGHRRIRGSKNVRELKTLLEGSGFLLRRRKTDVQQDLPELVFDEYPMGHGNLRLPAISGLGDELKGLPLDDAMDYLREHSRTLADWRHDLARVKIPLVKDYVETELETPGEKIIVFFHHTVLGRELYNRLAEYEPVIVDGRTKDAQSEVDEFQRNPNCRVFLGQISACQEALNITAATQVAFAEAAWSPSDNYQAACRAHRFGMGDRLVVRFLSVPGSPDEIVQRVLLRKAAELSELFD